MEDGRERAPKGTTRTTARRGPKDPGAPPTRASLHEAALAYLARSAASADSVTKTLERRVASWARRAVRAGRDADVVASQAATARETIPDVVTRLREVGLVDDSAFAEARAKRMASAGRSRRAINAHLAQKGIDAATVREAVPHDASVELAAAIAFARKRRLGPFAREGAPGSDDRDAKRALAQKALGTMARAGFDFSVCERVLRMDREDADERLGDHRKLVS